ncbi:hypothetical protein AURDEDRAFT_173642 [Auricularia subglabra TFB-10046 SS5]|nr:hypothetical protein AURDEDRAFT_173642 [Auricularia subglabra TFB-10046 SS5]
MPALTHFGLDVLDLSRFSDEASDTGEDDEEEDDFDKEPLDLDALERAIRAVLQCPRIKAVAMRVGGDWLSYWPDIVRIAMRLQDPRVFAWHDTRRMRSWVTEASYATSDAWAGRTIWTEARQIWTPSPSAGSQTDYIEPEGLHANDPSFERALPGPS